MSVFFLRKGDMFYFQFAFCVYMFEQMAQNGCQSKILYRWSGSGYANFGKIYGREVKTKTRQIRNLNF